MSAGKWVTNTAINLAEYSLKTRDIIGNLHLGRDKARNNTFHKSTPRENRTFIQDKFLKSLGEREKSDGRPVWNAPQEEHNMG